jgi:phage protein U
MSDAPSYSNNPPIKANAGAVTTSSAPQNIQIGSLDDTSISVEAQYNPKELQIDRSVPWSKVNQANQSQANQGGQGIHLEFTGAEGRSMSVELLFDGYEQGASIAPQVKALETMASVIDPTSASEDKRRPHRCVAAWGSTVNFRCVIESLSTKYTMFSASGDPLRATCTVKLKEADVVSVGKQK